MPSLPPDPLPESEATLVQTGLQGSLFSAAQRELSLACLSLLMFLYDPTPSGLPSLSSVLRSAEPSSCTPSLRALGRGPVQAPALAEGSWVGGIHPLPSSRKRGCRERPGCLSRRTSWSYGKSEWEQLFLLPDKNCSPGLGPALGPCPIMTGRSQGGGVPRGPSMLKAQVLGCGSLCQAPSS